MGMVLFTESGSFKPSDYGLSVGDKIVVYVVGGGGAGLSLTGTNTSAQNKSAGTAGAASSFGTVATAAGGSGSSSSTDASSLSGTHLGGFGRYGAAQKGYGGYGGAGWYFDIPTKQLQALIVSTDVTIDALRELIYTTGNLAGNIYSNDFNEHLGDNRYPHGGSARDYTTTSTSVDPEYQGVGGIGYGAGGGSSCHNYNNYYWGNDRGGCSGEIKQVWHTINTNSYSVTIGTGGSPVHAGLSTNGKKIGGEGARGAVAVFW